MLNQNYPRCIFIRTDCEIWAVKTWVIVALETDITHFPSRSRQWHANSVFQCVCARALCVAFMQKCQGTGGWGGLKGYTAEGGGSGRETGGGFLQARHMFGVVMQDSSSMFLHILPSPTCLSFLYLSASDPDLWPSLGSPDAPFWRLFFTTRERQKREERQKIRLQNTKSKINDGDGCAGAEGKEINPAPRSLCPHSWVQMRLWPWVRFGRTLCSGYWIAVTAPLRCIPLSSAGMLSVSYPGF